MSIRQHTEPVRLARAVAELLERLHVADMQMRLRIEFYRMGYAAGERAHADDYDRGFADGIAAVKRTDHQLVGALRSASTQWVVHGQRRTRQTYADPHPRDFKGTGNGAA